MDPVTTTTDRHPARYAAVVDALLGVRIDYAGARYDAAVDAALAAHRIDLDTARELRWWQRASVQAAQEYAATLVPQVLAACELAEARAAADTAELAGSWQQATDVLAVVLVGGAVPARSPVAPTAQPTREPGPNTGADTERAIRWNAPTRLVAVPDTRHMPRTLPRRASVEETQQAVRAAFRSASIDLDRRIGLDDDVDCVPGAARTPGAGRDERDHARSASST
jgi:hypothetical protein